MENQQAEAEEGEAAEVEQTVSVDIEADATLGYASIQNSVPVVRLIRVTNRTSEVLESVQVLVTCGPQFARGVKLRFDRLAPTESRRIAPVDLQPDHAYLADLQESVAAQIKVSVLTGTEELARIAQPVEVLAYDQWAGTRALPELLAAFSMPNNPAVDVLIGKASKLLRDSHPELSMNGYQSKSRDVVWKQVSAMYSTITAEGLQYSEPPASFGTGGQKIRTPDRILDARVATCLDLAMLFSSCLEQAGLRAVVLMKEGHAWIGVWLHQTCFPNPLTDDVQAVRKRVDSGEFLVFETTGVAMHHSHRPSLRIALEQGRAHLLETDTFRYAIDIHRARELQIKPLPSRAGPVKIEVGQEERPSPIEPTPDLPPLDADALTPLDLPADETPDGRLAKWKSRLLDLSLRNRLLNFKPTKTSLQLVAPDLAKLEDCLSDGTEFTLKPLPALMEGRDPRDGGVHMNRTGRTPLDDMALDALGNRELLTRVPKQALDGNLLALHTAARTGLEEGGANTLFLAIGLLRWTEVERADAVHLAPILLVPVTLQRQSVRSGYRVSRHDDEAIVNPTLLQLLKMSFELNVAGLDVLPADEKGIDVSKVLQSFRLAVRDIPNWEVLEQAHLGIFSFTKYLMWKDLQDRTEQLKANRVVKHLIEHPGEAFARDAREARSDRLDDTHRPQDILAPLLSDSSQLHAICSVDAGRDLVLEGPPGTGKSQTITNLIAHMLAKGKTVLFVSEKMAALEVVHRRLNDIGMGPFCLELHSSKAKKSDVLAQLGRSLDVGNQKTAAEWAREAERLVVFRQELNGLVDALHREQRSGLTVFEAIGTCMQHSGEEASEMPWPDALTHNQDELDKLRETVRRMAVLGGSLGPLQGHPLADIGSSAWAPSWQDNFLAAASKLEAAVQHLRSRVEPVAKLLHLPAAGHGLGTHAALDALADVLLAAPKVPSGLAQQAHDPSVRATVRSLAAHGQTRTKHWNRIGEGWGVHFAEVNAVQLQAEWTLASSTWWPKVKFARRAVLRKLAPMRSDSKRPSATQLQQALPVLAEVNEEDQILRSMHADAEVLLQESYAGLKTDWSALERHETWAKSFSDAVTRLGGMDAALAESLKLRLQPLVGDQRTLLSPNGAVGRALLEYRDAYRTFGQGLAAINELASPINPLAGPEGADGALERIQGVIAGWVGAKRQLQPWCLWRSARDVAVAKGLQGLVLTLESGSIPLASGESHFEHSYRHWWLKKTIDNDPILRDFSSADHERKIREFRQSDAKFQKLTEQYIAATLSGRVPAATGAHVGADSEMGRLRRELQRQRGHMPVRKLVQGLPTLLPKLKPCLLMSPLSVSQYLDAGHEQFDLVVFDEASQIPVWDAVGVIARGKQLVVVGDPKQLPPTNFFGRSTADDEGSASGEEQVEDLESILDECLGAGMNQLSLKWHYRSRHESLITFSNVRYYDSRLVTFPSPVTDDVAVRFERVTGVYDRGGSRTNRAEAEAIVKSIEVHFLAKRPKNQTLGVVTFNQPQQMLIETLLEARRRTNQDLDKAIAASSHEPLFIKNLENVQGDERDIIFFSITYGTDAAGKMSMNLGPLNGEGGHRRLNVAISRAREGVVIFSTLMPEQIDLSKVRAAGVRDLKHYLEFALRGPRALAEQSMPTGLEPDSPFETAVLKVLRDKGWSVHPQVGCSGYRIDMAVVDPRAPGKYLVGIECDGRSYHSGATARDRDRLRQHVLESLGWRIHRIWSTDWWLNAEGETEKLLALLQATLANEVIEHEAPTQDIQEEASEATDVESNNDADQSSADLSAVSDASDHLFAPATLPAGDPIAFYEGRSNRELAENIRQVAQTEGPVLEAVLFRRIARAWGLERTGSKIVERLRMLVPRSIVSTHEDSRIFYWPEGSIPGSWHTYRIASPDDEASRRHVDEVCLEELAVLVIHVLEQAGASPRGGIARIVCRLIGMARMPVDAEARVAEAVERLLKVGAVKDVNGYVQRM
jgi:very-short-patch-repair endonuclease